MRVVLDTNIVVSGLLWHGPSRRILDLAREQRLQLFTSAELVNELRDVLGRPKFATRLSRANVSVETLALGYSALVEVVEAPVVEPVVLEDPDDDAVIACAVASKARYIVSGDHHLLDLEQVRDYTVLNARKFLDELGLED
jgi:putative PIN family toxin of toxin-antitoxin system